MCGKRTWFVPDCFWDSHSNGIYESHESLCILNTADEDAQLTFTLYFEDREPMTGFKAVCGARRTNHLRLCYLRNEKGEQVPQDVPYALLMESSVPVVAQYSRMDTAQKELTLMTTIAYSEG